jgi:DNA-binding NtrC family response regulator
MASARLKDPRETLRQLAGNIAPVLLVGEEGTEREALARYLHAESPRRLTPFVGWDAARVPPRHKDRDLFGQGSDDRGLLRRSKGGTLFLDNADSLAIATLERIVVTLISADLGAQPPALVLAGPPNVDRDWPPDVAARLANLRVIVPPLRSETRDVLALAELFLSEMGQCPDGSPRLLTERTKRVLAGYSWPGNVRELRLVLESAAAQAGSQPIAPRHLPPPLDADSTSLLPEVPTLEILERQHIQEVMARTGGNRTRAAVVLGIASSTLYDKLKRYGLGT